jgi:hypothetical protein
MARRLETGGASERGRAVDTSAESEFVSPPDIDPLLVALAIEAKLRNGRKSPPALGDDPLKLLRVEVAQLAMRRVRGRQ